MLIQIGFSKSLFLVLLAGYISQRAILARLTFSVKSYWQNYINIADFKGFLVYLLVI
jgi:hypothetical protein